MPPRVPRPSLALPLLSALLLLPLLLAGTMALAARDDLPAEPPAVVVQPQSDPRQPGGQFVLAADLTQPKLTHFQLGEVKLRLEYRDRILHLMVLSGLARLELASGRELVILSTGDDIEISGLAPTADPAQPDQPVDRVLIDLFLRPDEAGEAVDAVNHVLRLHRAVPLNLRNNGGYPIAVNAQGKLLRLDEGGSGIALTADGQQVIAARERQFPRRRPNPAGGGTSATALLKP